MLQNTKLLLTILYNLFLKTPLSIYSSAILDLPSVYPPLSHSSLYLPFYFSTQLPIHYSFLEQSSRGEIDTHFPSPHVDKVVRHIDPTLRQVEVPMQDPPGGEKGSGGVVTHSPTVDLSSASFAVDQVQHED